MKFKGKKPDHTASYLSDKADQEKRDALGRSGKKLTAAQREVLAKDPKHTPKRLNSDQN